MGGILKHIKNLGCSLIPNFLLFSNPLNLIFN